MIESLKVKPEESKQIKDAKEKLSQIDKNSTKTPDLLKRIEIMEEMLGITN